MDGVLHAHPPQETEPECVVVWLLFTAHSGARKAARLWQKCFRNEVFTSAGWNAEAIRMCTQAENFNDDDNATKDGHSDSSEVEYRDPWKHRDLWRLSRPRRLALATVSIQSNWALVPKD